MADVKLDESWKAALGGEFDKPYMQHLKDFLQHEKADGKVIFPKGSEYFRALDLTPLDAVRVVILGQDPYHGSGQAHGLCFSVKPGTPLPPSLVNIYKEMQADLGIPPARHGFLEHWAKQGVLLLKQRADRADGDGQFPSGQGLGAIHRCGHQGGQRTAAPVVFILWGSYAQKKAAFVDQTRHLVLKSPHPSPLSAHNGFFGSKPFSKTNAFLEYQGLSADRLAVARRSQCRIARPANMKPGDVAMPDGGKATLG
ncbi:MAG: uracil-DNA glycosylase [Asticcacaulis sp.]